MSLLGALPLVLSGDIPNYLDAVFETVSGFTTTGSTLLTDVEAMSRGCMFWRMFTHWIGGMGGLGFIMGQIGPASCFNIFSAPVKMVLAVIVLLGRLELHPILAFFAPTTWRK